MSQSSYFKSRPELVTLGGGELGGGNLKLGKHLEWRIGMKLGGKIKHKS